MIAVAGAVLAIPLIGFPAAAAWLLILCLLEAALEGLAALAPRNGRWMSLGVAVFLLTLLAVGVVWSVIPLAFALTGRLALEFAGLAILVAQLTDVQFYTFRLRTSPWVLGFAPLCLFLALPFAAALSQGARREDLAFLAFCLLCTASYFIVAIRQNRLAAERLVASNLAAEAASSAKSAFVAMISHELRTPMNAIIGLAHVLKDDPASEEREENVDLIIRSSEGLMVLLNDVLDLSKVEAGKLSIERAPFDIRALALEIRRLWLPLAQEKGLALTCEVDPDAADWVLGDAARLRQVIGNLVSNAIKFTAVGGVSIRIRHLPEANGLVDLCVEVDDSGIGISAEEEPRLFQPFSQLKTTTGGGYGGTGLGLSISRALIELMGGRLRLKPRPGLGSTFQVRVGLPSVAPVQDQPQDPLRREGPMDACVLVVDDNDVNLKVAKALLTALGARAVTASDGAQALERLRTSRFDLVLLDVHMPEMNGQEVLRRIRSGQAGRRDVRVVACTADAMAAEVEKLIASGFDAVQPKPILPRDLAVTVQDALSARRADQAP